MRSRKVSAAQMPELRQARRHVRQGRQSLLDLVTSKPVQALSPYPEHFIRLLLRTHTARPQRPVGNCETLEYRGCPVLTKLLSLGSWRRDSRAGLRSAV